MAFTCFLVAKQDSNCERINLNIFCKFAVVVKYFKLRQM